MKFICTKENFIQSLRSVGHLSGKTQTLPILNNILLRTINGSIECVSTNLEIGITSTMRAKIEEEGSITLPARILFEYIQLLPAETITFSTEGTDVLIQAKQQKTKIRGTSADDFPVLPPVTTQESVQMRAEDLHHALSEVIFAAAQDENRVDISGIYAHVTHGSPKGQCTLAATDSYRLAERSIPTIQGPAGEIAVIIPSRTAHELMRIAADQPKDANAILCIGAHQLTLTIGDVTLLSRLIEGTYPNYRAIIPTTASTRVTIAREDLVQAVKRASLFVRPGINDITLHFVSEKKEIAVSAGNSQLGEHEENVIGEFRGGDQTIVFNYRYLLDGLNAMDTDEIVFEVNNNTSPVVLRPKGAGEEYLYLIMPIKQ